MLLNFLFRRFKESIQAMGAVIGYQSCAGRKLCLYLYGGEQLLVKLSVTCFYNVLPISQLCSLGTAMSNSTCAVLQVNLYFFSNDELH